MKEIKLRHLQKRLGVYRFRRKIPLDLQIHFDGKAELSFSLETKDRKVAEPLVRKWGVFFDEEFEKLRSNPQEGQSSTSPANNLATLAPSRPRLAEGLSIDDVNVLAARHLVRMREQREKASADKRALQRLYSAIDNEVYFAKEYIATGEHETDTPPKPMWQYEAFIKAAEALMGLKDLPYAATHKDTTPVAMPLSQGYTARTVDTYLADVVTKWASEQKPDPRTIHHTTRIISKFDEVIGKLPIHKITKLDNPYA